MDMSNGLAGPFAVLDCDIEAPIFHLASSVASPEVIAGQHLLDFLHRREEVGDFILRKVCETLGLSIWND